MTDAGAAVWGVTVHLRASDSRAWPLGRRREPQQRVTGDAVLGFGTVG